MYLGRRHRINKELQASQTAQQGQGGNKQSKAAHNLHAESRVAHTVQQDKGSQQSQATQSLHKEGQVPHTVQEDQGCNQQSQALQSHHVDDDVATGQDKQTAGGMKKYSLPE